VALNATNKTKPSKEKFIEGFVLFVAFNATNQTSVVNPTNIRSRPEWPLSFEYI
jgi:hypothetical protein